MKTRILIIVGALILVGFAELTFAEESHTFEIDGYTIITNAPNIDAIHMDWDSEHLPEFSVNFTEPYTGQFQMQIPKNMPRTMNLDFETTLMMDVSSLSGEEQEKNWIEHIVEKDFKMIDDRVSETESLCYYIVTVELSETDYFKVVTGSVASGRWEPVIIENEECNTLYDESTFQNRSVFPRHGFHAWSIPPLKQFQSGILIDDVLCKENLVLIQKYDGSPACVKPKSINILILRGWADEKFRTLPIIDFQNPDRIFREVGYLGLMMLLPHIEENQTIAISLEGKPNMVLPIVQRYDVEVLSEKTNTDESFSSVYGKITKLNLQKFFEENPMNLFVKHGVLLTSLGGYQDNTGTYGPFNQFLSYNDSQIIGAALSHYENKRTNGEDVHFGDFVKWPTGKINESFLQKSKLLDIASVEESRIALNPTDTCAHISLRLLSADKLEQYHARDKDVRFFEITEADLKELPVLDELIRATHHLEFSTNDDARAEMGLGELVDYEFFIMEKAIDKYNDSQDDYFVKLDGNLDEKLADPKPQGFSNEFLPPQLVYDDNVYVLSHTFFWVANEHETQHMSVHLQDSLDNDEKFITLTEKDMESIPKIKQAMEKIGTEFESIRASKGLPENPDWNEYREWFGQKKTEQFNLDETYVPGFVYDDEYYDLGFPIC